MTGAGHLLRQELRDGVFAAEEDGAGVDVPVPGMPEAHQRGSRKRKVRQSKVEEVFTS